MAAGPPPADFAPVQFSTSALPEEERLARWREEFGRRIIGVEIEPLVSQAPFHASAILQALPDARIASCVGSAARLERTRALAADGDDSIGLVVNLGADLVMSQRGRDATLRTGEALLISHEIPAVLNQSDIHLHGLSFPRAVIAARMQDLNAATMRAIPRSVEPLRMLVGYLDLIRKDGTLTMPQLCQIVAGHIHDLAALAFGPDRDTRANASGAIGEVRLAAALAQIARRFTEPGLSVEAVARSLGISARYLRHLLGGAGTSFTARVNELRLQKAFALLRSRDHCKRRISDIAMDVGFADISHFNHRFRARFGDTPGGVRGDGGQRD